MTIKIGSTANASQFKRILCYSLAGMGKTWLVKTLPNPIIISSDKGLDTLEDDNFPVIEVSSIADIEEAKKFVVSDSAEMKGIETVCTDSWDEIAEIALAEYAEPQANGKKPNGMDVYGKLGVFGKSYLKFFRDIVACKKHVYMTAKMARHEDEYSNLTTWAPNAPGTTLRTIAPYYFNFVFALRMAEGKGKNGEIVKYRYLQTQPDIQYYAKSRGDSLDTMESPDLTKILNKVLRST